MLFGTFPRLSAVNSCSITLNNNVIKRVFHFTYLGIAFDDRLSWNEQNKAAYFEGLFHCSLTRPILEFCVSVWGCCGEGHKYSLEALQNWLARIVTKTVRSNQQWTFRNGSRWRSAVVKLFLNSLRNVCMVNC